ncbi:MAG: hypothetical protein E8D41_01100 [Nitrospira sp.]|nr:MAG: hypothetical protein E8D41_01100 [Nitrospira sp.]
MCSCRKLAAASRQSTWAVVAVGVGVAVNLTLNVFLAPIYGLYGIAVAMVVGSACSSGYLWRRCAGCAG